MKEQKECKLCSWNKGRIHTHHIIPLSAFGEDTSKNKILLCPNHHAEATKNWESFREEHNLESERFSDEKMEFLKEASCKYVRSMFEGNQKEILLELRDNMIKYDLDIDNFMSYVYGVGKIRWLELKDSIEGKK